MSGTTGTASVTPSRFRTGWAWRTPSSSCAARHRTWCVRTGYFGMPFDRNPDGTITSAPSGGHTPTTARSRSSEPARCRPHRPRDAAHAVPAKRQGTHQLLRRMDGSGPDPRRPAMWSASPRWRWKPVTWHPRSQTTCWPPAAQAASSPPPITPSSTPAMAWVWRHTRRHPATGYGVLAVPPHRRGWRRRAADRGCRAKAPSCSTQR